VIDFPDESMPDAAQSAGESRIAADLPWTPADARPLAEQRHLTRPQPHVPQLSIRYLLLWTTGTAVALLAFELLGMGKVRTLPLAGLSLVALAMVIGWLWMGTTIIVWHAARGTLWRVEPGEWLLTSAGSFSAALLVVGLFLSHPIRGGNPAAGAFLLLLVPLAGAVFQGGVLTRSESKWWGVIHWANMAAYGILWFWPVALLLPPLVLPLLAVAAYGEYRDGRARHWHHYSGVAIYGLALLLLTLCELVYVTIWLIS